MGQNVGTSRQPIMQKGLEVNVSLRVGPCRAGLSLRLAALGPLHSSSLLAITGPVR